MISYLHYSVSLAEFNERKNAVLYKWRCEGLAAFVDYFTAQWLTVPFCNWQLFNTPPGYPTCNICESFNAEVKKTYTLFKKRPLLQSLGILERMITDYSVTAAPFSFFRKHNGHDIEIIEKSESLNVHQFMRLDYNTVRFDSIDSFGRAYSRHIFINPFHCNCRSFWDKSYCHHILAINRLKVASIILYPNYVEEPPKRRLTVRNLKRNKGGRPKNLSKALVKD